ncbi:MAG: hypothetical protein FWG88_07010 [Oscillospiraceae bacterium]|nr:hypothetical protein [Oscillospiraceae bacterium]
MNEQLLPPSLKKILAAHAALNNCTDPCCIIHVSTQQRKDYEKEQRNKAAVEVEEAVRLYKEMQLQKN